MALGMTKITLARFTPVYLYNYVIQWDIFLTLNFVKTNVMGIIHHDALILSNYHNSNNNTKQLKLIYNIVSILWYSSLIINQKRRGLPCVSTPPFTLHGIGMVTSFIQWL